MAHTVLNQRVFTADAAELPPRVDFHVRILLAVQRRPPPGACTRRLEARHYRIDIVDPWSLPLVRSNAELSKLVDVSEDTEPTECPMDF